MPRLQSLALPPALPSELLTYVLAHQAHPTTLIICQPRSNFLTSLLNSIDQTSPISNPSATDDPSSAPAEPSPVHPLLIPTLHQIATSRSVKVVFIPTVSHLRAYLAAFGEEDRVALPVPQFEKQGKNSPLIVVYGLVGLHRDTSEWSAQGLGNSVSALVEVGERCGRRVVCFEEREDEISGDLQELEDEEEEIESRRWKEVCKVWEQRVPMLNGSVRRAGMGSEDEAWSGRTIEAGRIFGRWFRFEKADWV
ncbi:hypothetical protein GLAREA_08267 [Glarea lozoyensis ATCC 20868]|uniref:Uncharacterized protein n=1 Tax=Glarea lozoyensis (strain ATCC 20868 / MF5171) TaxID=1116229 RepID=S3CEI2_GLAL2|nr:uncharacterized protein GLAREA_08267 [Glarea lozoyensis ATCC 20868]EPE24415.1 hypothetical protein GLAREA_08267 [Glarea lozoyensis ATCC 20868]